MKYRMSSFNTGEGLYGLPRLLLQRMASVPVRSPWRSILTARRFGRWNPVIAYTMPLAETSDGMEFSPSPSHSQFTLPVAGSYERTRVPATSNCFLPLCVTIHGGDQEGGSAGSGRH